MTFDSVQSLARRMAELGASKLYVKELASNDNTKNQIYLGPSFGSVIALKDHRNFKRT